MCGLLISVIHSIVASNIHLLELQQYSLIRYKYYLINHCIMHEHKRRDEGVSNKAPNTGSRLHNEVRDEFAKTETFVTDTQGLKLAYENPDGIYQKWFYTLLGLKAVEMFMLIGTFLYIRRN